MAKKWLALISDNEFIVARVAVKRNKDLEVHYIARYPGKLPVFSEKADEAAPIVEENYGLKELKNWLQSLNINLKKTKLALSGQGLITRVISVPKMTRQDLESLMSNHIDQYFTIDVSKYLIDYRIIRKYQENEKPMLDILLAAFPMEKMEYVFRLSRELGFEPSVIDLSADCIARIYGHLVQERTKKVAAVNQEEETAAGDMAIVSLHSERAEFVLLRDGQFFLYSDMEADMGNIPYLTQLPLSKDEEGAEEETSPGGEENEAKAIVEDDDLCILYEDVELHLGEVESEEILLNNWSEDYSDLDSWEVQNRSEEPNDDIDTSEGDGFAETMEMDSGIREDTDYMSAYPEEEKNGDNILIGLPELDFSEVTGNEDYQQAALRIRRDDSEEQEFLLEDLFVPLDNLSDHLKVTKIDENTDEQGDWASGWDSDIDWQEKVNSDLDISSRKENIFDTLDLDKTLIGLEELELDPNMNLLEQLEAKVSPVLTNLTELLGFFAARNFGNGVNTIYLTGSHCTHPHLPKIFKDNLGISTVAGFPNGWRPKFAKGADSAARDWQKYACLYGLALRED